MVGGDGGCWQSLDGRGQLDSRSIRFWWQGGKTMTAVIGDVEVKRGGSNAINYSLSSFIILWLGEASKSCEYFQEVPRKSPGSPQEVPRKSYLSCNLTCSNFSRQMNIYLFCMKI